MHGRPAARVPHPQCLRWVTNRPPSPFPPAANSPGEFPSSPHIPVRGIPPTATAGPGTHAGARSTPVPDADSAGPTAAAPLSAAGVHPLLTCGDAQRVETRGSENR
jgi:hypothetical protein